MIDNYADRTVDETVAAVSDFDAEGIQRFIVYEREHKNRKGVIRALQDELVTVYVPETGYYNGYWFDDRGEHVVRDCSRIRRAIEQTALELQTESV